MKNQILNQTRIEVTSAPKATKVDFVESDSPLYATRRLYKNYLGYTEPLTFVQWCALKHDDKAAALFVQYFEQISLAWYKTRSFYAQEEEAVETIMQYLMKNVSVIAENPKRFNASYIYQVAYNCLYCISHDRKCDKDRFEYETSNIQFGPDGEFDLFDTVGDARGVDSQLDRDSLWAAINALNLSDEMLEFVYSLCDASKPKRMNDEKRKVVAQLRVILQPYLEIYYK